MKTIQPVMYTNQEVIASIIRFIEENGNEISSGLYREQKRKPAYTTILNRFGTWKNALREASIQKEEGGGQSEVPFGTQRKKQAYTEEELLESVRRFVRENNGKTSSCLYREQRRTPSFETVIQRFGKWEYALNQAGCLTKKEQYREACLASVKRFLKENPGETRSTLYVKQKRVPTAACVIKHFGSWKQAIEEAKFSDEIIEVKRVTRN